MPLTQTRPLDFDAGGYHCSQWMKLGYGDS